MARFVDLFDVALVGASLGGWLHSFEAGVFGAAVTLVFVSRINEIARSLNNKEPR